MNVFLTSAYDGGRALECMRHCAENDRIGRHSAVDDPDRADILLFVENAHYDDDPEYRQLARHELVNRHRERAFMYNEVDRPWCVLPGLYCSMPRRSFDSRRQRAFCYAYSVNPYVAGVAEGDAEPDLLYSFAGARTHRVRGELYELADPSGYVSDSSDFSLWRQQRPREQDERYAEYAQLLARSKFVLCPRGAGTSTYRLFEAMEAARAPVVISDQWVPPTGPRWESFLLRVPERAVAGLPTLLRRHEDEFAHRGASARAAWEEWFAPDVRFTRAVDACGDILAERRVSERVACRIPSVERWRVRSRRAASRFRQAVKPRGD